MKKLTSYLFLCLLIVSCSDDNGRKSETSEFLGKWKMTETLTDPGDGSGTYQPVTDNYTLEFLENGKIRTNYSLCNINSDLNTSYTAPYYAEENYIKAKNCSQAPDFEINYAIEEGKLILYYPCIEACNKKFERVIAE